MGSNLCHTERGRGAALLSWLVAVVLVSWLGADAPASAAPACTISFDGGAGTTAWATAANWDTDVLPGAADDVCIGAAFTVVHSTGTDSVLSIQSLGHLALTGGSLSLTRTTDDSTIADLQLGGTLSGSARVVVAATMTWSGGTMSGAGTTVVAAGATLSQTGGVTLANGRILEVAGTFADTGDVTVFSSGAPSLIHVLPGGIYTKSGGAGTGSVYVPLTNDGTVRATSGSLLLAGGSGVSTGVYGPGIGFTGGAHVLGSGATLTGNVSLTAGSLTIPEGATVLATTALLELGGGTLTGAGTLRGPVANSAGAVSPGASLTGILTIDGNYSQGPAGRIQVDVAGSTPGSGYDQLHVTGAAALDGTLEVSTSLPASRPTRYAVLTCGACGGTFATVTSAGAQSAYAVDYTSGGVTLLPDFPSWPDGLIGVKGGAASVGDDVTNATGIGQLVKTKTRRDSKAVFLITIQNDGFAIDSMRLKGTGKRSGFAVTYLKGSSGSTAITSAVRHGTYVMSGVMPGAKRVVRLVVKAKHGTDIGNVGSWLTTATSTHDGSRSDAVKAVVRVVR